MADGATQEMLVEESIVRTSGEVVTRQYRKGKYLGKGGFARCYEFTSLDSRKNTAAKIIPKASLKKLRTKHKLMAEIRVHQTLQHPHVVAFEHFFEDVSNVYVLLELCPNQTMLELLRRRTRLTELEVQCYGLQLISGLEYLYAQNIVHRDLKLGNLLLGSKLELKIGDFGLAAKLQDPSEKRHTICGTPNYIAPEVLDSSYGHSFEVDVWGVGVILYTLLVGKPPFETASVKTTYQRVRLGAYTFPDNIISLAARDLISKLLVTDPGLRLSLEQVRSHQFFNPEYTIPAALPLSTLVHPPAPSFLRKFGLFADTVPRSLADTAPARRKESTERKNTEQVARNTVRLQSRLSIPTEVLRVKKWVDCSSKYGLGYILSNGCTGVFFNDATRIVVDEARTSFFYFDKSGNRVSYLMTECPPDYQKKLTLLRHFQKLLEQDFVPQTKEAPAGVHVKRWTKTKQAIIFRLSNKALQVHFQDHTELILSSEDKQVAFLDKLGVWSKHPTTLAMEEYTDDLAKRLKYAKEVLAHMSWHKRNSPR